MKLYTTDGKRKYLTSEERDRFLKAANQHERGEVWTLCLVMAYTGCRISEALALTADKIDLSNKTIIFRTLKQRQRIVFRVPVSTLDALDLVHRLRKAQKGKYGGSKTLLWSWKRCQVTKHICEMMAQAGISGAHASPTGVTSCFRGEGFGRYEKPKIGAKMIGHRSLKRQQSMEAVGNKKRELVSRMR